MIIRNERTTDAGFYCDDGPREGMYLHPYEATVYLTGEEEARLVRGGRLRVAIEGGEAPLRYACAEHGLSDLSAPCPKDHAGPPRICGQSAWPYTENNICVLAPGHLPGVKHQDRQGRQFGPSGYDRKEDPDADAGRPAPGR